MERFPEKVHRIPGSAGDLLTTLEHTNSPFHYSAVKVAKRKPDLMSPAFDILGIGKSAVERQIPVPETEDLYEILHLHPLRQGNRVLV